MLTRIATLGILLAGILSVVTSTAWSAGPAQNELRFEVAMDGTSFSHQGELDENGAPAVGTPFVVEGYIYPEGTFATYGELSGVNQDGSPEFPELVIGTWSCRGWHLLDGSVCSGVVVATTQIFDFAPELPGAHTIVTDGIELAAFNVPFRRAVTGGTGRFLGLVADHAQVYVGDDLNVTGGFNTTFAFSRSN